MHLSKVIKEGMSGEAYAGLIDGVQAIVLTLLVLEMPDLIINIIEKHLFMSSEPTASPSS